MICNKCGGRMIGDGFTEIIHCENAEYESYYDLPPDDTPVECDNEEDK